MSMFSARTLCFLSPPFPLSFPQRMRQFLGFLLLGCVLVCLCHCSNTAPCDTPCQNKIFPCFQQLRDCESICSLPPGETVKCVESTEKGEKRETAILSSQQCGECRTAFASWKQGKDCDSGQEKCALKITNTGLFGYLLQKCVLILERWTWSDGRLCDAQDKFPCVEVDSQMQCLGCNTDSNCVSGETCNTTLRRCVACTSDTNCSPSGRCVKCTEDSHCRPAVSGEHCSQARCVCEQNSDCQVAGFAACNTTTQTCTPCQSDSQCPVEIFGLSKCSLGRCLSSCQNDSDCSALKQGICVSGRCLPGCQTDTDCQILQFKFCENKRCYACRNHTDCPSTKPFCHPQIRTCTVCTQDSDCPKLRPICDTQLWYCRR